MIKVLKVRCIHDFTHNKKRFSKDEIYKGYKKDGSYIVINSGYGVVFDKHIRGRLRSGEEYLNNHFEEVHHGYVKNKIELREYIYTELQRNDTH